ncbi:MAG TPA: VOC family protein, partial [Steroidobacteraceae bacterium]|nr:VOC family protein [Steroidobacteraceae bacterium]
FLEYSIPTPDIGASLEFYAKLGFTQAEVGETWTHPYAVVTDGRLHLGLHQEPGASPGLTFVKPDVLHELATLEGRGVTFEYRRLGNDVFNELGWLDPSGHLIRLIEARTFSPSKRARNDRSLCGYFLEIGLPAPDRELAKQYWEQFGFVGLDEPSADLPHVSCTSDSIDIGLYDPAQLRLPTLVFDADDVPAAITRLAAAGIEPSGRAPAVSRERPAAMLAAPEGTPILLLSGG